jgi:hypothetical protein
MLSRWLAKLRRAPEESEPESAEHCLELLCDAQRAPTTALGEHEQAVIEAERRRWESGREPAPRT